MQRCCIVLPTQSVLLSQLAAGMLLRKAGCFPNNWTHPTPAPTQLFCETIKPSQDLHSLCLKFGYALGNTLPKMLHLETTKTVKSSMADLAMSVNASSVRDQDWLFSSSGRESFKNSTPNSQLSSPSCAAKQSTGPLVHQSVEIHRDLSVIYTTNFIAKPLVWPPPWWAPVTVAAPKMKTHWKLPANSKHTHTHMEVERKKNIGKQQPQGASNHLRIKNRLGFQAQAILVVVLL